jgi:hypothetical protein
VPVFLERFPGKTNYASGGRTDSIAGFWYNIFLGERAFESWITALAKYETLPYRHLLPGHGAPAGPELYGHMRHYLTTAHDLLSQSADGPDFKARLIAAFPHHGGRALIDRQLRFLFPPQKEAKA